MEVALSPSKGTPDDSYASFFEAEYDGLYRRLLLLVGSRGEADELAQEAMVRVYERWDRVREMGSPSGYAYAVAFNRNGRMFLQLVRGPRGNLPNLGRRLTQALDIAMQNQVWSEWG